MRQTLAILKFTLRENFSNKLFKGFIVFALLLVFSVTVLKNLALYSQNDVIIGVGQFFIEFFLMLIAIFASSTQYFKDKREKSIYLILTKPVSKANYIIGKALGIIVLVAVDLLIMAFFLTVILLIEKAPLNTVYFLSYLFIFYKLAIIVCVGILFSVISDSIMSANIFTIMIYILAYAVYELPVLTRQITSPLINGVILIFYYILPNYYGLTIRDALSAHVFVSVGYSTLYTLGYCGVLLAITAFIFSKKEL